MSGHTNSSNSTSLVSSEVVPSTLSLQLRKTYPTLPIPILKTNISKRQAKKKNVNYKTRLPKPDPLTSLSNKDWKSVYPFYIRQYIPSKLPDSFVQRHSTQFSLQQAIHTLKSKNELSPPLPELQALSARCKLAENKNSLWLDRNRVKLVHYFPHFICETNCTAIIQQFQILERYILEHNLSAPKSKKGKPSASEKRHANFEEQCEKLKNTEHACGTFRMTVHHQQGHYTEAPGPSSDLFGGTCAETLMQTNFRCNPAIAKLSATVSKLFAAIDPQAYQRYREIYLKMVEKYPSILQLDNGNPMQCFVGYYVVLNLETLLHRDCMDPRNGWVAMAVFGCYEGGELYLPDILLRLPYKNGDIVFMRSWALQHFVSAFNGTRYVIVLGTPWETMKMLCPSEKDTKLYTVDHLFK